MQIQGLGIAAVSTNTSPVQSSAVNGSASDAGTARASGSTGNTQISPATGGEQVAAVNKAQTQQNVVDSVQKLNDMAANLNVNLQFSVDPDTKMEVVKVVDSSTKEVIRQIPSEEVIDIAKAIDKFQGMLVRDKA
jgi:flagellar protein FlaG